MNERKCIGFGEHEGRCGKDADANTARLWCVRCNQLRMEHLDRRMDEIRRWIEPEVAP